MSKRFVLFVFCIVKSKFWVHKTAIVSQYERKLNSFILGNYCRYVSVCNIVHYKIMSVIYDIRTNNKDR